MELDQFLEENLPDYENKYVYVWNRTPVPSRSKVTNEVARRYFSRALEIYTDAILVNQFGATVKAKKAKRKKSADPIDSK